MVTYGIVKQINGSSRTGLFIRGHANYVKKGPDIVCAAVSAIGQAAGLGVERFDHAAELKRNQNGYWMFVCDSTAETRAIIVTAIAALDVLREQYPECFAEPDEYTQSIMAEKYVFNGEDHTYDELVYACLSCPGTLKAPKNYIRR